VNALTHAPGTSAVVKLLAGIAPQREVPRFAREPFVQRFRRRPAANPAGPPVVLWPDTFNDHLTPEVLEAAADVLEHAGYRVLVPEAVPCCGRPLYDFGMLDAAARQLGLVLASLAQAVRDGVPVVALEPSCLAVFRDELTRMLPGDPAAKRLGELAVSLAELLVGDGYAPPQLGGRAVVHGHCHHKAVVGMAADERLLAAAGVDAELLDAGCCGMAGAFGFDRRHYDVSMRVGELALLPAVRSVPPDSLLMADGFSCREQILHATGRRALHTAEVLRMALGPGVAR
jgi:Fe-S oxidoreductase